MSYKSTCKPTETDFKAIFENMVGLTKVLILAAYRVLDRLYYTIYIKVYILYIGVGGVGERGYTYLTSQGKLKKYSKSWSSWPFFCKSNN